MSDKSYQWGHEHFCEPDTRHLYNTEPERLNEIGYPKELDHLPVTFCSVCLEWFSDAHPEGSDHQPPKEGHTNGNTA